MEAVEQAELTEGGGRRRSEGRIATVSLKLLSDERLAHLAAEGNKAAFATIYERHHQALYRYCRTITRNDEDARDALQATMLNAMRAIDTKPKKLRAWLYRIAHNESISVLRSGKRHAAVQIDDVEPSAEAPLESRRELRELLDDIGHLSDRQRQALVMRELGGLGYDEIGVALECSPAAAKQAAFDARGALHELSEARDTDCEAIRKRISDGDRRLLRARGVRAHLRTCDPCRHFEAVMQNRKAKLAGLVPVLSPAASAAILQSVLGGGAGGAAVAAGTAGGGAAAVGGGAAAAGGGAAAVGGGAAVGGAALSGAAVKGIVAGVAAVLATGGAIAVKEERSGNDGGGNGSAAQVREAETPAAAGGGAAAGASEGTEASVPGTGGESNTGNATATGDKPSGQAGNNQNLQGNGSGGKAQEGDAAGAEGTHPQNPGGTHPGAQPQPGAQGAHPPRPQPGPRRRPASTAPRRRRRRPRSERRRWRSRDPSRRRRHGPGRRRTHGRQHQATAGRSDHPDAAPSATGRRHGYPPTSPSRRLGRAASRASAGSRSPRPGGSSTGTARRTASAAR